MFGVYNFEWSAMLWTGKSEFLLVNLFRQPIGAMIRLDAINKLIAACARQAGIERVTPPRLAARVRQSTVLNEIAALRGARVDEFAQVYLHPDPSRLRKVVELVHSPRESSWIDW
ncbi:hypothetical protein ABFA25_00285 [Mycobacterium lepromatosis]|uniref:hypothetical protein n=2 Tax=Mycobacterium lepromatosis TaxID=480418 RepID=UPI001EDBCBFB|nr:hypothetical protein [Mycobacterium lepromatosis]